MATYTYNRNASKPVSYAEGDTILVNLAGVSYTVKVEDRVTKVGKPGFVGVDQDNGRRFVGPDDAVVKVVKAEKPVTPQAEGALSQNASWVKNEVLSGRVSGKWISQEINQYLRGFIQDSQKAHSLIREAFKASQGVEGFENIRDRDLEEAIYKTLVQPVWGDDPMGKLLAKVIAHGDYVY
jgi:hypothetical protein